MRLDDAHDTSRGEDRRRPRPPVPETGTTLNLTAETQHRAALFVVAHATDPDDARELLDMLGLLE